MEIKKNARVDLERRRVGFFLLGLVVSLSVFFVAMEYTARTGDTAADNSLLDDMAEDVELMPALDTHDMVSAAAAPASKAVTAKVKESAEAADNSDRMAPVTSPLVIGDGEGVQKDATVTEALPQTPVDDGSDVLRTVEQLPEFPGGMVEFMKWLTRNLKYPPYASARKIQGKVVVSFIVNKDGSIASPKIEKSCDPNLDREALRIVRMMPKWKPGIMDGKPCRTMIAVPVNFQL